MDKFTQVYFENRIFIIRLHRFAGKRRHTFFLKLYYFDIQPCRLNDENEKSKQKYYFYFDRVFLLLFKSRRFYIILQLLYIHGRFFYSPVAFYAANIYSFDILFIKKKLTFG